MDFAFNPVLLAAGVIAFLFGMMVRNFVSRYDFAGMIASSFWHLIRGRRRPDKLTEVEERFKEIGSAATTLGKARRLSGNVIGHFVAPILGLIGLVLVRGGIALVAASFWFV